MSETQNGQFSKLLPAELQLALRSATWNALIGLRSLRSAVEEHVRDQCADGVSHDTINEGLRSMIVSCAPALTHVDYSAERTKEVTIQVMKWSAMAYRPTRYSD